MSKIKMGKWFGGHDITVDQKNFYFRYIKPGPKDLKRKGKTLSLSYNAGKAGITIKLNGTQINTLKKILKVAGEIG